MSQDEAASLQLQRLSAVQGSFSVVYEAAEKNGRKLYQRMCDEAPELSPLLEPILDSHAPKLMDMINAIVTGMGHPHAVLPLVRDLAVRHAAFGIRPDHYDLLGRVLIETLADALGPAVFTPFVQESWESGYAAISRVMVRAAYGQSREIARSLTAQAQAGLVPERASA